MPKSAFVKANMCHETMCIEAYNDYCFCLKKKALTPEVPYGSSFVAWTKFVVINNGSDSSKLICSVEAEFPNGSFDLKHKHPPDNCVRLLTVVSAFLHYRSPSCEPTDSEWYEIWSRVSNLLIAARNESCIPQRF